MEEPQLGPRQMTVNDLTQMLQAFIQTDKSSDPSDGYKGFPVFIRLKTGEVKMVSIMAGMCFEVSPIMVHDESHRKQLMKSFERWPSKGFYIQEL